MNIIAAVRLGEKIKTLLEEFRENFPEGQGSEFVNAYDAVEEAEKNIDNAVDFLASRR